MSELAGRVEASVRRLGGLIHSQLNRATAPHRDAANRIAVVLGRHPSELSPEWFAASS